MAEVDGVAIAGIAICVILLGLFVGTLYASFPQYNLTQQNLTAQGVNYTHSLANFTESGPGPVGDKLWGLRQIDLLVLAMLLFISAIACIALLRR